MVFVNKDENCTFEKCLILGYKKKLMPKNQCLTFQR